MARKKKDGRFINYYIDRGIFERLERYAQDKALPMTTALERILDEQLTQYESEAAATERYCPNCHILVRSTRCPQCDRRWLEEPKPEDYCLLSERDVIWSGVLEDCLRQNGILYLTQNVMGAGLTSKLGNLMERIRVYVRYGNLAHARDLEAQLFTEVEGDSL